MLEFYIAVMAITAPIALIMWKKRFYQGLLLGQLVFLHAVNWYIIQSRDGPFGWVGQYFSGFLELNPRYAIRWPLPTLIHGLAALTGIEPDWVIWLFLSAGLWWLGTIMFCLLLTGIGFDKNWSTLGAAMPLLTLGAVKRSMFNPDAINLLVVLGIFWAAYSWRYRQQPKWLLLVPPAIALAAVVEFPVTPTGGWAFWLLLIPYNLVELAASIGVWGVFIAVAVVRHRNGFPQFTRMAYWFLPVYAIVFAVAVDWDRWFLLAAPIWVPMVLVTLQHITMSGKSLGKNAEDDMAKPTRAKKAQRGFDPEQQPAK